MLHYNKNKRLLKTSVHYAQERRELVRRESHYITRDQFSTA